MGDYDEKSFGQKMTIDLKNYLNANFNPSQAKRRNEVLEFKVESMSVPLKSEESVSLSTPHWAEVWYHWLIGVGIVLVILIFVLLIVRYRGKQAVAEKAELMLRKARVTKAMNVCNPMTL